ncbi:CoA-transferase family III [Penicillium cf. viridicatum]|uniref:CoA-transferase family III n=1 Tax=Penicillium cf. viridicatum TaxID=2972119 RepID=A0A9W9IWH0_9EURO|nr:CoA-transferase family III [Penicillium cf. viridicatum]
MTTVLDAQSCETYSVPAEAQKVFLAGILQNPLVKGLPVEIHNAAAAIKFVGSHDPSIVINWRFAESIASLKAFEGAMLSVLLQRKYGVKAPEIVIDTQLFVMSAMIWTLDPDGEPIESSFTLARDGGRFLNYFPNWDTNKAQANLYRSLCTNVYKTKDDRYFHLHGIIYLYQLAFITHANESVTTGSMNPEPTLASVGLPHWMPKLDNSPREDVVKFYQERVQEFDSADLEHLASEVHNQAGTICWTPEEYFASEHGQANGKIGLYEIHHHANPMQEPCWWPSSPDTSANRPLAGLKVVDLARVIAGPAISRGLAEMGASVMRVAAPHLCDFSFVHCDMNWGKWNSLLDLRLARDQDSLRALIEDADVVVTGYRPGVLDKYGFSEKDILKIGNDRGRGIIYARENSYGWYGPWAKRSGWQQISDANCGVAMEYGRGMGLDEPVIPVFPNSDYCTGVCGTAGVLDALLRRATGGGSYTIDIALNYYSQWLVRSVGTYPEKVWQKLWSDNGRPVFRHYHTMFDTIPAHVQLLKKSSADRVFHPRHFQDLHSPQLGVPVRVPKPVLQFPQGPVQLKYNVGTRTNGVDQPRWPEDLAVEVVV